MRKVFLSLMFSTLFFGLSYADQAVSVETGSGFLVSRDGIIVTCARVVEGGTKIMARIDGVEYPAQVLSQDTGIGLAVVKINYRSRFHFGITSFDSTVNLGDKAYVLGFPRSGITGSDIRLTDGLVSAKSGVENNPMYFQVNMPLHRSVQPGNNGGPILSTKFSVIGAMAYNPDDSDAARQTGQDVNFGVKSDFIRMLLVDVAYGKGNVRSIRDAAKATVQIMSYTEGERAVVAGSRGTIRIVNRTGYEVYRVYLSPSDDDSWGRDMLGSDEVLSDGQSKVLPLSSATQYDIRIVDEDGDSYTKMNVRLSPNETVEFTPEDLGGRRGSSGRRSSSDAPPPTTAPDGSPLPTITLVNKTGYTVKNAYVSPADDSGWGRDVLGDEMLSNGESITVTLPLPIDETNKYDLMMRDTDDDRYTKWDFVVTPGQTIEFLPSDID